MHMRRLFVLLIISSGFLAAPLRAQLTNLPFQIRVDYGQTSLTVPNYASLTLPAEAIGKSVVVSVTLTYTGRTQAALTAFPLLIGSSDFAIISPLPEPPVNFVPGDNFRVQIRYTPSSTRVANGQISFIYTETPAIKDQPLSIGSIAVSFNGVVPEFAASYALQTDANIVPLSDGGVISFPPTLVGTATTATILVVNKGSGPGAVQSVSLSGSAFQLLALPLLPASVPAGDSLRFGIRYAPKARGEDRGSVTLAIGEKTLTVSIEASAIAPGYVYELFSEGQSTPITPGKPVTLPPTPLGESTSVIVQIKNTGDADGTITGIALTGPGFTLSDLPIFPLTLAPNDLTTFVVNFAPTQPGRNAARLRIGNEIFDLAGTGIGPKLTFAYTTAGVTSNVGSPGLVPFQPVTVGQSSILEFTIRNTGTTSANVGSIGISTPSGAAAAVFRLVDPPALPLTLQPEQSVTFSIRFTPATIGQATASLFVDALSFTLSGFGTDPPALPAYRFTGAIGTVEPFDQPAIGLTLASPYPLPLRGTLTLTVDSDLPSTDPAVQFAFGGRQATFTVPANSTQAIFQNGSTNLRLQTGTVAGTITITPAFTLDTGLDLTPKSPDTLRLQVPKQAPRLFSAQVTSQTATGFVLVVTGYSTTRSLGKLDITFTAASDVQFPNAKLTINLDSEASLWFKSPASQSYGGQFSVSVPFTLRTEGSLTTSPLEKLDSLSVTATNEVGTSNAVSARIR